MPGSRSTASPQATGSPSSSVHESRRPVRHVAESTVTVIGAGTVKARRMRSSAISWPKAQRCTRGEASGTTGRRMGVASSPAAFSSSSSASAKPAGALVAVMRMVRAASASSASVPLPSPPSAPELDPPRGSGMDIGSPGVSHFDVDAPPARICTWAGTTAAVSVRRPPSRASSGTISTHSAWPPVPARGSHHVVGSPSTSALMECSGRAPPTL